MALGDLDPASLPEGLVLLGRYRLAGALGRGGMGAVYEAEDLRTERRLALKVMGPDVGRDPDLLRRFELEARAPSRVGAHVVPVLDAGLDPETGLACLAMEKLEGEELGRRLARREAEGGGLDRAEALAWLEGVARALDALHAAGVVHRDVKPENVFRMRSGEVRVLDLGIARLVSPSRSLRSTRSLGSPLYMAPEQLEGDPLLDGRADVYAFGHLAFACLAGQAYWQRAWSEARGVYPLLLRMMRGGGPPASEEARRLGAPLPATFDAWFGIATARSPEDRFDTAGEALSALRRALDGAAPRRPWRWGRGRRRGVALSAGLAALCAAAGLVAWAAQGRADGSRPASSLERPPDPTRAPSLAGEPPVLGRPEPERAHPPPRPAASPEAPPQRPAPRPTERLARAVQRVVPPAPGPAVTASAPPPAVASSAPAPLDPTDVR